MYSWLVIVLLLASAAYCSGGQGAVGVVPVDPCSFSLQVHVCPSQATHVHNLTLACPPSHLYTSILSWWQSCQPNHLSRLIYSFSHTYPWVYTILVCYCEYSSQYHRCGQVCVRQILLYLQFGTNLWKFVHAIFCHMYLKLVTEYSPAAPLCVALLCFVKLVIRHLPNPTSGCFLPMFHHPQFDKQTHCRCLLSWQTRCQHKDSSRS